MEGYNVVSLFDGLSCAQIALNEVGIKYNNYFASEIDKHAMKVTQHNYPNTIQVGDVTKVSFKDGVLYTENGNYNIGKVDILCGGSPCQGFSFAGKQLNFEDPRSKLFFEYVRILKECNPTYFLLENVFMKKEYEQVITDNLGVYPIKINSALVSGQNRNRNYWTNINKVPHGLFGDFISDIPQPKDKGILLKDILDSDVDEKYYLSNKALEYLLRAKTERTENVKYNDGSEKTSTLSSNYHKGVHNRGETYVKIDKKGNKKLNQDKASCFTAGGDSGGNHSDMDLIIVASRGREAILTPKRTDYGKAIRKEYESGNIKEQRKNIQQLEPRTDGKTNTLTSVQKNNLVMQINPSKESGGKQPYQQNRVYDVEGVSPALLTGNASPSIVENDFRIRRLTPNECKKLQTVPDYYDMSIISDTQQYRALGNGWTIEVIKHIFSFIK